MKENFLPGYNYAPYLPLQYIPTIINKKEDETVEAAAERLKEYIKEINPEFYKKINVYDKKER